MNEPFSVDQYRAFLADERERLAMAENAMTTWRDDYDRLYQEIQVLRAQCAAQAAALARIAGRELSFWDESRFPWSCDICMALATEPDGIDHAEDCPVRIARAARAAVGLEPP